MEAKPYGLYCATFDLNFPSILNVAHITSLLDTETKKIFIFNILVYVITMNYWALSFGQGRHAQMKISFTGFIFAKYKLTNIIILIKYHYRV